MSRREGVREESLSEEAQVIEHQLQASSSLHGLVSQPNAHKMNFSGTTVNSNQTSAEVTPSQDGGNAGSNYTCSICKKQYAYKISLNKHIKSAHAN